MRWLIAALLVLSTCHPLFFLAAAVVLAIWANGTKENAPIRTANTDRREAVKTPKP